MASQASRSDARIAARDVAIARGRCRGGFHPDASPAAGASLDWREKRPRGFRQRGRPRRRGADPRGPRRRVPGARVVGEELSPDAHRATRDRLRRRSSRRHDELPARLPRVRGLDRRASRASWSLASSSTCRTGELFTAPSRRAGLPRREADSRFATSPTGAALIGTGFPFKNPRVPRAVRARSSAASCARPPASGAPARPRSTSATSPAGGSRLLGAPPGAVGLRGRLRSSCARPAACHRPRGRACRCRRASPGSVVHAGIRPCTLSACEYGWRLTVQLSSTCHSVHHISRSPMV